MPILPFLSDDDQECTHRGRTHYRDGARALIQLGAASVGDRSERWPPPSPPPACVPIIHPAFGGEENIRRSDKLFCRHALTKLAHLHAVVSVFRVNASIAMGERPIAVSGAPAIGDQMRLHARYAEILPSTTKVQHARR
jgi:hypothetical protein